MKNEWYLTSLPKYNGFFPSPVYSSIQWKCITHRGKITLLWDEIDCRDHQVPVVINQRKCRPLGGIPRGNQVIFSCQSNWGGVVSILWAGSCNPSCGTQTSPAHRRIAFTKCQQCFLWEALKTTHYLQIHLRSKKGRQKCWRPWESYVHPFLAQVFPELGSALNLLSFVNHKHSLNVDYSNWARALYFSLNIALLVTMWPTGHWLESLHCNLQTHLVVCPSCSWSFLSSTAVFLMLKKYQCSVNKYPFLLKDPHMWSYLYLNRKF